MNIFYRIQDFWNKFGFEAVLFLCIIFIIILWYFQKTNGTYANSPPIFIPEKKKLNITGSKGEKLCKQILENTFQKPFIKIRPHFLKNDLTGKNMEIDMYNEEMKLAVEYSGAQHYYYNPHFHRNRDDFERQKYRDKLKEEKLRDQGIILIVVPYDLQYGEIEPFLLNELKTKGYL